MTANESGLRKRGSEWSHKPQDSARQAVSDDVEFYIHPWSRQKAGFELVAPVDEDNDRVSKLTLDTPMRVEDDDEYRHATEALFEPLATDSPPSTSSSDSDDTAAEHAQTRAILRDHVFHIDIATAFAELSVDRTAWYDNLRLAQTRFEQDEDAMPTLLDCRTSFQAVCRDPNLDQCDAQWLRTLAGLASSRASYEATSPLTDEPSRFLHSSPAPFLYLRCASTDASIQRTDSHVAVGIEFSRSSGGSSPSDSSKDRTTTILPEKLLQLARTLTRVMAAQPSRTHVPGLAICNNVASVMVLTREALLVASVADCWSAGRAELAAVVKTVLGLKASQIGLSPLFRYRMTRQDGMVPSHLRTDVFPDALLENESVALHLYEPIDIVHHPRQFPFSRGTIVLAFPRKELAGLIVKVQAVRQDHRHRERDVWRVIDASGLDKIESVWQSLSRVQGSVEFRRSSEFAFSPPSPVVTRHYTLVLSRNPSISLPQKLMGPSGLKPKQLLQVIRRAFEVLWQLFNQANVLHCDISSNNVLHDNGNLVLIDWDCAIVVTDSGAERIGNRSARTGTVDTMARDVLKASLFYAEQKRAGANDEQAVGDFVHMVRHDFESLVYVLLKFVWKQVKKTFVSTPSSSDLPQHLAFGEEAVNVSMKNLPALRLALWGSNPSRRHLAEHLRKLSPALADFVKALLSEPFEEFDTTPVRKGELALKEHIDGVFSKVKWEEIETPELMQCWT
ncbi:hypothetical protein ACM66B_006516 [Microbotryomycetes sp. NB124-2]